jgi:hypothetical protein
MGGWRFEDIVSEKTVASEALRLGQPTWRGKGGDGRSTAGDTSKVGLPQAQCLARSLSATEKIDASNSHHFKAAQQSEIGTPLAPSRPVIGAVGVADFGRAAHNRLAAGAASLAARAHEATTTAPSTGHGAPTK